MVWVPPLILTSCPITPPSWTLNYYGLYHFHPCIPWSVIGLKSLVTMVIWHCTLSSIAWINLICTSCITNEYCTVFHPTSAQVWRRLHRLHNKWILHCIPPHLHKLASPTQVGIVYTIASCITNEYCTPHLRKLHNKWILYCVPPLICTKCIANEHYTESHPHLHKFDVIFTSCITKYCTVFHPSFAQVA